MTSTTRSMGLAGLVSLSALVASACGGSTATNKTDAGGPDAQTEDAQPQDAQPVVDAQPAADAPAEAGYLACFSSSGQLSDSLKPCQADSDCVIEQEQTDCCGTILYVGVNSASATEFQGCETAWVAHFPGCGCASNKMTTEDGKTANPGVDGGAPQVHCADFTMSGGICLTFTP
jgi:hypothetical protein